MTIASLTQFGQLPALRIEAPDGASAIVTLFGAHVVAWHTADGRERLFCSRQSPLDGSAAIRGGVPVIFPQFSTRGSGMRHGYARVSTWRAGASGLQGQAAYAEFHLRRDDVPAALAHESHFDFELTLRVTVQADQLELAFEVRNSGAQAFAFSAALHSYHAVTQLQRSSLAGLDGLRYSGDQEADGVAPAAPLPFSDHLDRIYYGVSAPLTLHTDAGTDALQIAQSGFADVVVWNPGRANAAALKDMADDEYERFVCVEAAQIAPLEVVAGASWTGTQRLRATR